VTARTIEQNKQNGKQLYERTAGLTAWSACHV